MRPLLWHSDRHLEVGDVNFALSLDPADYDSSRSALDRFVLLKDRGMLEALAARAQEPVERIVELGIFKGGSIALYSEMFQPKTLVGVELHQHRVPALDEYVSRSSLEDRIHLFYGTSQSDRGRIEAILEECFGDEPLDLVVDDGSHRYSHTKASLNLLLPRMRPGGLYVIEDWGWAHWPGDDWQHPTNQYAKERTPLTNLVFELVMASATDPGLISEVDVANKCAFVTRGPGPPLAGDFDISTSYLTAGRKILHRPILSLELPNRYEVRHWLRRHDPRRQGRRDAG
jgi:predicted O-methyltransferase YrrM